MTETGNHVLLVRPGALGDTILTLPLLRSIRSLYPGSRVLFLGTAPYQVLLPHWVDFERMDDPRGIGMRLLQGLSAPKGWTVPHKAFVVLKNPANVMESLRRWGVKETLHVSSHVSADLHVVEHLHRGLGLSVPEPRPALLHLRPSSRQDLIWLHPGSGGPRKCVDLSSMMELAQALQEETGWGLAISVGEADGFVKDHPQWRLLVEESQVVLDNRPLPEVCRRLGGARLFVGNDSGVSHLAGNLGIPSVVLFRGTRPEQWLPWVGPEVVREVRAEEAWASIDNISLIKSGILRYFRD